eukprot:scaffold13279_cov114-Isochrysis_galbana.AAC.4
MEGGWPDCKGGSFTGGWTRGGVNTGSDTFKPILSQWVMKATVGDGRECLLKVGMCASPPLTP